MLTCTVDEKKKTVTIVAPLAPRPSATTYNGHPVKVNFSAYVPKDAAAEAD